MVLSPLAVQKQALSNDARFDLVLHEGRGIPSMSVMSLPAKATSRGSRAKTQILDPVSKTRKLVVDEPTKGLPQRDVWDISILAGSSKERIGYPTQKRLNLLDRIIKASSNEGYMILDPFAGCATACVAAERLGRHGSVSTFLSKQSILCRYESARRLTYSTTSNRSDDPTSQSGLIRAKFLTTGITASAIRQAGMALWGL